jgi:hypothetical protein
MLRILAACVLLCALISPASARHHRVAPICDNLDIMHPCAWNPNPFAGAREVRVTMKRDHVTPKRRKVASKASKAASEPLFAARSPASVQVVAHPAGCPARSFCGCGAAVRVFGAPVRSLWVAANWFRFPRAVPAPGMVAVRSHHVFVLEARLERGLWLAYDANSGRHLTRIHARSIKGYVIVNPH